MQRLLTSTQIFVHCRDLIQCTTFYLVKYSSQILMYCRDFYPVGRFLTSAQRRLFMQCFIQYIGSYQAFRPLSSASTFIQCIALYLVESSAQIFIQCRDLYVVRRFLSSVDTCIQCLDFYSVFRLLSIEQDFIQ